MALRTDNSKDFDTKKKLNEFAFNETKEGRKKGEKRKHPKKPRRGFKQN